MDLHACLGILQLLCIIQLIHQYGKFKISLAIFKLRTLSCSLIFFTYHCYQCVNSYPLAEPPKITTQPKEVKDTVPGKPVSFTIQATGAEPLSYQWQWKPIGNDHWKMDYRDEKWQNLFCDVSVLGTDTPTLTFSSSESCSEGLYRCTVTDCAGAVQSECVDHIIGELARVTTAPQHVHTHQLTVWPLYSTLETVTYTSMLFTFQYR